MPNFQSGNFKQKHKRFKGGEKGKQKLKLTGVRFLFNMYSKYLIFLESCSLSNQKYNQSSYHKEQGNEQKRKKELEGLENQI